MCDTKKEALIKELARLEQQFADQKDRIPPHNVRPHQMEELERLEDEWDRVKAQIQSLAD